jgi:hypothetical protein
MRKILILPVIGLLVLSIHPAKGSQSNWAAVRLITQGYRNVSSLVEASITFVKTFDPDPGDAIHVISGLESRDFDELAVRLQSSGGTYAYLLEVWTRRGGTWRKTLEYSYNDGNQGEIIIDPYAFDSINYNDGSLHRIIYNHTANRREMTLYSVHSPSVNSVERSIGVASEQGGYVDLYFSAHLDQDFGGSGANDAYLFGARIGSASPHYCTAKQGIRDQGDTYDFTGYGTPLTVNAAHFTESGFVSDGETNGAPYPPAADVDSTHVPTAAEVSVFTVSFQSTADPDFS